MMPLENIAFLFASFPVLETDRLHLIQIEPHHLDDLFQLFGDGEVTRFYNIVTLSKKEEAQKFIDHFSNRFKDRAAIRWGIALKEQNRLIGTLGFNNFTPAHRANIGYDLLPDFWNQGYMSEALKAVLDFGFYRLNINRMEAEVMPGNMASERLLQKLGFLKEGVLRDWMLWNGRHYDMTMFALLQKDFLK